MTSPWKDDQELKDLITAMSNMIGDQEDALGASQRILERLEKKTPTRYRHYWIHDYDSAN